MGEIVRYALNRISYQDNYLLVNDNTVPFLFGIQKIEVLDDRIIVLLSIPFESDAIENMYAVARKLEWL